MHKIRCFTCLSWLYDERQKKGRFVNLSADFATACRITSCITYRRSFFRAPPDRGFRMETFLPRSRGSKEFSRIQNTRNWRIVRRAVANCARGNNSAFFSLFSADAKQINASTRNSLMGMTNELQKRLVGNRWDTLLYRYMVGCRRQQFPEDPADQHQRSPSGFRRSKMFIDPGRHRTAPSSFLTVPPLACSQRSQKRIYIPSNLPRNSMSQTDQVVISHSPWSRTDGGVCSPTRCAYAKFECRKPGASFEQQKPPRGGSGASSPKRSLSKVWCNRSRATVSGNWWPSEESDPFWLVRNKSDRGGMAQSDGHHDATHGHTQGPGSIDLLTSDRDPSTRGHVPIQQIRPRTPPAKTPCLRTGDLSRDGHG